MVVYSKILDTTNATKISAEPKGNPKKFSLVLGTLQGDLHRRENQ